MEEEKSGGIHFPRLKNKAVSFGEKMRYPLQLQFPLAKPVAAVVQTIVQIMRCPLFHYILMAPLSFYPAPPQQYLHVYIFVRSQGPPLYPLWEHNHILDVYRYLYPFHLRKQYFLREYRRFPLDILLLFPGFVLCTFWSFFSRDLKTF